MLLTHLCRIFALVLLTASPLWAGQDQLVPFRVVDGVASPSVIYLDVQTGGVTVLTLDTGYGANELWDMDQHVLNSSDVQFNDLVINTINSGQGVTEVFLMNQNLRNSDTVTFGSLILATDLAIAYGGTGASSLDDILGTTNQITVTAGAGTIVGGNATLSLPQSIHTAADVTFNDLTLAGNLTVSGTHVKTVADGLLQVEADGDMRYQADFDNDSTGIHRFYNGLVEIINFTDAGDIQLLDGQISQVGAGTNTFAASTTFDGNTVLGNADTDSINPVADFIGNLDPNADDTYDLGTEAVSWDDAFFDTLDVDGNTQMDGTLTVDGDLLLDGTDNAFQVQDGGIDGGWTLDRWTGSTSYMGIQTGNMTGSEYVVITNGTHTYISSGTGGVTSIRGPANDSSDELRVAATYAQFKGTVYLGDANSDNIYPRGDWADNLDPNVNATYDIGSSSYRWDDVWGVDADFSGSTQLGDAVGDTLTNAGDAEGFPRLLSFGDDGGATCTNWSGQYMYEGDTRMSATYGRRMLRAGSITGVSITVDVVSATALGRVYVARDGNFNFWVDVPNATGVQKAGKTQARGETTFSAGAILSLHLYHYGAGWTGTTTIAEYVAEVEVYYD